MPSLTLHKDDILLLTTDGLHDRVPEEKLVSILRSNSGLDKKLDSLVTIALEESGKDNVTVVAVQV
jgi:protein phosphatase